MKKTLTILTLTLVVIAGAAMVFASVSAQKASATPSLCHTTALSIKAPASVAAGKTITVKGAEARTPPHSVKATLQSRRSTSTKWINGASANLSSTGSYALRWKAPARKGTYKIRVRVSRLGASHRSAVRTVTVK
jgi:hypothetical protein